jgi:hypothetical protein
MALTPRERLGVALRFDALALKPVKNGIRPSPRNGGLYAERTYRKISLTV